MSKVNGVGAIAKERMEQIVKHGHSMVKDLRYTDAQLANAAQFALTLTGWPRDLSQKLADSIAAKPYRERLAIAGAFIAAEIDRLEYAEDERKGAPLDVTIKQDTEQAIDLRLIMLPFELKATISDVMNELASAEKQHPNWPTNALHAAAVVAEESGELIRAAVQLVENEGSVITCKGEAMHTAATAIRFMMGDYKPDEPRAKSVTIVLNNLGGQIDTSKSPEHVAKQVEKILGNVLKNVSE